MKKIRLQSSQIEKCSILSKEEAESIPSGLLLGSSWSWLRTKTFCKYYVAGLSCDGRIDRRDAYIYNLAAVRPALYLKEELLTVGTKYIVGDTHFIAIAKNILLYNDLVMKSVFAVRSGKGTENGDYDVSAVKKMVDEWYAGFAEYIDRPCYISKERAEYLLKACIGSLSDNDLIELGFKSEDLEALGCSDVASALDYRNEIEDAVQASASPLSRVPAGHTPAAVWDEMIRCYLNERGRELDSDDFRYTDIDIRTASEMLMKEVDTTVSFEENIKRGFDAWAKH